MKKHKYNKRYWLVLDDINLWYSHKYRKWMQLEDIKSGSYSSSQIIKNIKKLNKVLNQLEQEGFKGTATVTRFLKRVKNKGHLTETRKYEF